MIRTFTVIMCGAVVALLVQWGFAAIAFTFNPEPSDFYQGWAIILQFLVWGIVGIVVYDQVENTK